MTYYKHRLTLIANNHLWLGGKPNDARVRIAAKLAATSDNDLTERWAYQIWLRWSGSEGVTAPAELKSKNLMIDRHTYRQTSQQISPDDMLNGLLSGETTDWHYIKRHGPNNGGQNEQ